LIYFVSHSSLRLRNWKLKKGKWFGDFQFCIFDVLL
jgi:hypothetical protein